MLLLCLESEAHELVGEDLVECGSHSTVKLTYTGDSIKRNENFACVENEKPENEINISFWGLQRDSGCRGWLSFLSGMDWKLGKFCM